jgi:predicted O-methyltransferase YrrM
MDKNGMDVTGERWQAMVAQFIRTLRPNIVVETGVQTGVSTRLFLEVIDEIKHGRLISIDPFSGYENPSPRWTFLRVPSYLGVPQTYIEHGPFDIFIHDSDHDAECQTLEYEFAWLFTKPGGFIVSDDISWGCHNAWDKFLARHRLESERLGAAGVIRKPLEVGVVALADLGQHIEKIRVMAHAAGRVMDQKPRYFLE